MAILLVLMIAALVGADQLVKYWAVNELKPIGTKEFIHIGDFKIFDLTYLENQGAIFGSMAGKRWFLVGFTSIVVLAGIVVLYKMRKRSKLLNVAIALFIAGGIGNLIDRIRLGYVVDMIEVDFMNFAVFNIADCFITCGAVALFVYILFFDKSGKKEKKNDPAA